MVYVLLFAHEISGPCANSGNPQGTQEPNSLLPVFSNSNRSSCSFVSKKLVLGEGALTSLPSKRLLRRITGKIAKEKPGEPGHDAKTVKDHI